MDPMKKSDVMKKKILITGAGGEVGKVLASSLSGRYDLVLTDIRKPDSAPDCVFHPVDINDGLAFRPLCTGVHTVVHLAAVADENAPWDPLLQNNIIGLYKVFEAAADAGCRRMIFASSIYAVDGYPKGVLIRPAMPVRPPTLYGATKAFAEALGSFYAYERNLPTICLRLGWVLGIHDRYMSMLNRSLETVITHDDLIRLFIAAIEAPDRIRFGIFHGLSDNRRKRLDIQETIDMLGYRPRDDAFGLAIANERKSKADRSVHLFLRRVLGYLKRRFRAENH
jgi:uronate dehydrogenase